MATPELITELERENRELRARLAEAEEALRAVARGQAFALKGDDEAYRFIVREMAEGAVTLARNGLILFANEQFARLVGTPLERVIGGRWQDFVFAEDSVPASQILGVRKNWKTELRLRFGDTIRVPVNLSVESLVLQGEDRLCLIVTDLSEQNLTEKQQPYAELQASEARALSQAAEYQAIMDAVPAGVFIARDPECLDIFGNQMAYDLMRMRRGENLSKSASEEQRPEHFHVVKDGRVLTPDELPMQKAVRTREPVQDYECEVVFKDGKRRWWLENAVPLLDEKGDARGAVGAFVDITERKLAELEIQKQAIELARANEDLLHFAYAASHDLQAPLRNVSTFAQFLALRYKAKLDEEGDKIIETIIGASARMGTMLRDLLQFATVAGSEARVDDNASLEHALATALSNLKSEIQESGATITYDPLPSVTADGSQFAQLLQNLIGNSIKYRKTDVPPEIRISAKQEDGQWIINIGDNGIGFDAKHRDRIFGVFQRLHSTEFPGTGIGLTICKRIVERRGGRIWADSHPGEGATFSFSIPIGISQTRLDSPRLSSPSTFEPTNGAVDSDHLGELFQALDLAPALIRKLDGTISIWTQGAERLFGWSKSEAVGKNVHDLIQPEFPFPLHEIEAELLRKGEWKGQVRKTRRDGARIWLASHWTLYRDGAGRPHSVIVIDADITALKNAEEALRRSSQQRDVALQAGRMGVWRWDIRSGAVEWDATVERMHGMATGAFEGTLEAYRRTIHPDDRATAEARVAEALQDGSDDYFTEHRALRNDGSVFWVRGQGSVIRANNEVTGLMGVVCDITERKQNEQRLAESLERLKIATKAAQLGVLHFDIREGRMHWENPRMYEIFGRNPDAGPLCRDEFFASVIHPDDADRVRKADADALNGSGPLHQICRIRRGDGALRWIEFNAQTELDADGTPLRLTGVAADITDRVEAEGALREQQQYTRSILDSLQTFVGVLSPDGVLLDVNRAALEAAGIQPPEVIGKSLVQTFWWSYSPEVQKKIQEAVDQARSGVSSRFDIQARMKDGQLMTLDWMICPLRDENGEIRYLIPSAISIEERKQMELALRQSEERYRLAEWATNDGLWDWTPGAHDYCYFSPRFKALVGLQDDELENRAAAIFERLHPEDEPVLQEAVRLNWEQRKPYSVEVRLRMKDGRYRWFRTRGEAVRDDAGNVVRMTGAITDIHQQKEAAADAKQQIPVEESVDR